MASWDRHAEDLVVGTFAEHQIDTLRREFAALQDLVAERLRAAPGLLPFSSQVQFAVTASLPEDGRLRAILAHACGADEPEWVWQWYELDVLSVLDHCCTVARGLVPDTGTQMQVRSYEQAQAMVGVAGALGAVAAYRVGTEIDPDLRADLVCFRDWCDGLVEGLRQVATVPPLPQTG